MSKKQFYLFLTFFVLYFIGCAAPVLKEKPAQVSEIPGIWHCVERGQTLWRISKVYGIDLEELARINNIYETRKIDVGQFIFIPYATQPQKIQIYVSGKEEEFIWPAQGEVISFFGERRAGFINKGIDIQPKINRTQVLASRSGKVTFCGDLKGYTKTIIIDHGDGFSTVYMGNKEITISLDDYVTQGSKIARCILKEGTLHFEIRKNNRPLNPIYFLPR